MNGATVAGLIGNEGGRWGGSGAALPTWRSGIGTTAEGNVVYVAGNNLSLVALGDAPVQAGVVTGMELDIHRGKVAFNLFTHVGVDDGHQLLPDMGTPPDRYLVEGWRDFVMVNSR